MMNTASVEYTSSLTAEVLRKAFGRFPTGVVGVCARVAQEIIGLAASSFVAISLDPPLISFCIRNESGTWRKLSQAPRLGITVLSESQAAIARALAGPRVSERFSGLTYTMTTDGAVFVDDGALYFDCSIHDVVPAGDHQVVILTVHAVGQSPAGVAPLLYYGSSFRQINLR
jgi:flavin reductase (DIM6/NTAB) family NADH-FMN oxidoreductase RutF